MAALAWMMAPGWAMAPARAAGEITLVALGDSLTAGFGLSPSEAFPARLEAVLRERGHDVRVINAGVSGDTASAGLARLDWAVDADADGVIVELGANDALRGIDPGVTRDALDAILARLGEREIPVLLAGMRAPPNMGTAYTERFDAIYPALAEKHGVPLYPFFLEGVAARAELNQQDGIHPNAQGVAAIVTAMTPYAERLIALIRARRDSSE
jgi:acyl-CoA thioesterase-1